MDASNLQITIPTDRDSATAQGLRYAELMAAQPRRLRDPSDIHTPTFIIHTSGTGRARAFCLRDFLLRYPRVHVVAHATDQNVDIVGENYDVAIRAHSEPLPDSTLVQRTLTPASRTSPPARAAGLGQPPNRHSTESHGESSVIGPIGLPAQNMVCAWIIASPILTSRSSSPFRPMLCAVTRAPSSSKNSSSASISGSASEAAAHS